MSTSFSENHHSYTYVRTYDVMLYVSICFLLLCHFSLPIYILRIFSLSLFCYILQCFSSILDVISNPQCNNVCRIIGDIE